MTITVGQWTFDGPHLSADGLRAQSGVYAVLGRRAPTEQWTVVDIGESQDVQDRIRYHDRAPCWRSQGYPALSVAALYCNGRDRMTVESTLRGQFNPPCGQR